VFYVLHGDDAFSLGEELAGLRAKLAGGDPVMGDLNTTTLEGSRLTLGELRHSCDAIPFMADRRLVIVEGLLWRLAPGGRAGRGGSVAAEASGSKQQLLDQLAAYLPHLPPTTRLVFVENETLPDSHPILEVARAEGKHRRAWVRQYRLPRERDLPGWIRQRAEEKGGGISSEAVSMLAGLVGTDLRLLDQEIEKLLLYADDRQVTSDDVQALVSHARETSIFDLVDCVGRRQTDRALQLLHRLLEDGEAPLYLLTMLARQIRILIQVAELQERGLTPKEVARRLKLHPGKGPGPGAQFRLGPARVSPRAPGQNRLGHQDRRGRGRAGPGHARRRSDPHLAFTVCSNRSSGAFTAKAVTTNPLSPGAGRNDGPHDGRRGRLHPGPAQVPGAGLQVAVQLERAIGGLHLEETARRLLTPSLHIPAALHALDLVAPTPPTKEPREIAKTPLHHLYRLVVQLPAHAILSSLVRHCCQPWFSSSSSPPTTCHCRSTRGPGAGDGQYSWQGGMRHCR